MRDSSTSHPDDPCRYEIRLKGRLSPPWATRFSGMTLSTRDDGTTVLDGPVADQAALHALLRTLRDLGLPLVSLTQVHPELRTAHPTPEVSDHPDTTDQGD